MNTLPDFVKNGYLRLIEPIAGWLARRGVNPNHITIVGTLCTVAAGVIYGTGHIRAAGAFLGLTAMLDVLDGSVARRSGRSTAFGAFFDSTLDRIADGAVLGGLAYFYATDGTRASPVMVVVTLLGMIGAFLTSYTRARAEGLGVDARVGLLQRPERVVLLSAPQALFGLALDGWVLSSILTVLTVTAWVTVVQRMHAVYAATTHSESAALPPSKAPSPMPAPAPERTPLEQRVAHP
ncbi:MAG: CDP-alcohol phosphatidyltransferase family protein [Gemmatimonadaceae bacterium]